MQITPEGEAGPETGWTNRTSLRHIVSRSVWEKRFRFAAEAAGWGRFFYNQGVTMQQEQIPQWVPVQAVIDQTGISPRSLQRRVASGDIRAMREFADRRRVLIFWPDVARQLPAERMVNIDRPAA